MKNVSRKNRKLLNIDKSRNVLSSDSKFAIVEGYKIARTNIVFSLATAESNCVAVTSWTKGEGKSTATVNLAISFAKTGKRVLLIDADLRRPNVHNLLKLDNSTGLSAVIGKLDTFENAIKRDVVACLDVMTAGEIPPNPSELIGSPSFALFIEQMKEDYDYVIIDTPPIGVVADTLLLKNYVAGFVLVVREKVTSHGDIEKALQNIKLADSKILGFLRVGCSIRDKKYYNKDNYGYYKYY